MASKTRNASATKKKNHWKLWACLDKLFWVLNSHHSSLFTHHLKIPCLFGTITHFPSLNIFHTICGPHTCHRCSFYFFFFSFQYTNSLNPVKKKKKNESQRQPRKRKKKEKKEKKKKKKNESQCQAKKKKKRKKKANANPKKKKNQKVVKSCGCGSPMCV